MSTSVPATSTIAGRERRSFERTRAYFFSDTARSLQTALGVLWLLDGLLQLQPFMYSRGFISFLTANAPGQPQWAHSTIIWGANLAGRNLTVYDTAFASIQVLIGLGLLHRPTVKLAVLVSCAWALVVWWFGEGFGMMLMTMASPLTGAPGAVILYPLIGLIAWPNGRPGGLLGVRGTRLAWAALWLAMAWLWLMSPSSAPNAFSASFRAAPSGMSWLSTIQYWAANATRGAGVGLALALALASALIAVGVYLNWRARELLIASILLNLIYWVLGQGFGGIFTGQGTDPNAGLLFVLLAVALYALTRYTSDGQAGRVYSQIEGRK